MTEDYPPLFLWFLRPSYYRRLIEHLYIWRPMFDGDTWRGSLGVAHSFACRPRELAVEYAKILRARVDAGMR